MGFCKTQRSHHRNQIQTVPRKNESIVQTMLVQEGRPHGTSKRGHTRELISSNEGVARSLAKQESACGGDFPIDKEGNVVLRSQTVRRRSLHLVRAGVAPIVQSDIA